MLNEFSLYYYLLEKYKEHLIDFEIIKSINDNDSQRELSQNEKEKIFHLSKYLLSFNSSNKFNAKRYF